MRSRAIGIALIFAVAAFLIIDGKAGPPALHFILKTPEAGIAVEPGTGGSVIRATSEDGSLLPSLSDPGHPELPVRMVNVIIPPGQRVTNVHATARREAVIANGVTPVVATQPDPGPDAPGPRPAQPVSRAGTAGRYPAQLAHYSGSGTWHGCTIASIAVYPLRMDDADLVASTEIELTVELQADPGAQSGVRARRMVNGAAAIDRQLRETVLNPEAMADYPGIVAAPVAGPFNPSSLPTLEGSAVEYVIITTQNLTAPFDSLAEWKTRRGVPTVVRTVEWIQDNYRHGTDLAETIRFFLRDAYANWGTHHVLLAGDTPEIPPRYLYSEYFYGGTYIPADIYFAALDGTFNADGDERFGEQPADAPDLWPELNVARLPVSTLEAASVIVSKIKAYETAADAEYTDKVLFLAEVLFPSPWSPGMPIQSNGGTIAEEIRSFVDDPSRRIARVYETPEYYPGATQESRLIAIDSLQAGYNMVFHIGHGYRFNMHCGDDNVSIPDADALEHPNRIFNLFMLNCTAAAFDFDCLGEHMLRNPSGGAISIIGASNSAFPDPSRYYAQAYANAVYVSGMTHIGEAFMMSRASRTNFAALGDGVDLWTHYIYTILADPEMRLWTGPVGFPDVSAPAMLTAGQNTIAVQVAVAGLPQQGATVCLYKPGEDYAVGSTNPLGEFSVSFASALPGSISVVISGENLARTQRWIEVQPAPGAQLVVDSMIVDDDGIGASSGNGDGRIDAGETVELRPRFRNVGGTASSYAVSWLTTSSTDITLETDSLVVPSIEPDSAWTPPGATWIVSASVAGGDGTRLSFDITTIHAPDAWKDGFAFVLHAPALEVTGLRASDEIPFGNGDGVLSPGESYLLYVKVRNYGSGRTGPMSATLTALDSGAVVAVESAAFPDLGLLEEAENLTAFQLSETSTSVPNPLELSLVDDAGHVTIHALEMRPPLPPVISSFDATLGPDKIKVMWAASPSPDVAGYRVHRSNSPAGPFARVTPDIILHTVFTDAGLAASTRFYYVVSAVDSAGNESPFSGVGSASTNPPQFPGWPNEVPDATANSPAIGDINGDGYPEVIIGNRRLYAWHHTGEEILDGDGLPSSFGVFSSLGDGFIGPPALANIDGAPGMEIVAAAYTSQEIFIFNGAAEVLPGWPRPTIDLVRANVALGDVDGDGNLEVVAVDQNAYLYVWHTDGTELMDGDANPATDGVFKRLPPTNQWQYQPPALADLDNDGREEIIIATQDKMLYVFNDDGSDLTGWPRALPNYAGGGVVVGDIDGNGDLEIVLTVRSSGETYALNHDNTVLWVRWLPHNLFFNPPPVLADLTGDGKLEVIIPSSNGRMYAIQYNGSDAPGWPVTYSTKTYSESSPIVADITGDGQPDVLLGNEEKLINAWSATGQQLDGFPLVLKDAMRGSPAVVDIDINGDAEIVAVGYDRTVYIWNLDTPYDATHAPWPMARANVYRNGMYGSPVATGVSSGDTPVGEVRLAQNYPNPFNPTTTITFELPSGRGHHVVLSVYDVTGARVRTLVDSSMQGGRHVITWDGRNHAGSPVGTGVYFYRLIADGHAETRKMVLLK